MAAVSAAAMIAGQCMLAATVMTGRTYMAMAVPRLVGVEVIEGLSAALGPWPTVSMPRVEAVVDVAIEVRRAMKPRAGSDEYSVGEPIGPIVAVRRAIIGRVVEVTVRAHRSWPEVDPDRELGRRGRHAIEQPSCDNCTCEGFEFGHDSSCRFEGPEGPMVASEKPAHG